MAKEGESQDVETPKPENKDASAQSRPIIVRHNAVLKDSAASNDPASEADEAEEKVAVRSASAKVIQPLSKVEKEKIAEKPEAQAVTDKEAEEQPATEAKPKEPAVEKPEEAPAESLPNPETKDAPAEETAAPELDEAAEAAAKSKQAASDDVVKAKTADELMTGGKYKLDVSQDKAGTSAWLIAFIVLTVLSLIGAYLAIDADILDLDISLPFEFIG